MDVYEKLREILDAHPSGAPESKVFDEILRTLFTPEEAEIAVHMSFSPKPLETIAAVSGIPLDEAEYLLESMADKAIIFSREKDGAFSYGLLPTIPGLFEYPLMRGGRSPMHERLGKLWTKYRKDGLSASFAGKPTPMTRVVPVGHALDASIHVHPYEEVSKLIEKVDYIALGYCACRVSVGACKAPKEVCFFFDAPARFLVERRYAREINKEEALRVLDSAEKAGLVHTSSNSADRPNFICNCCPCCCVILTCRTRLHLDNGFATSAFQSQVNKTACTGCGLCVTGCPASAMILVRRSEQPDIPATLQEMGVKVLTEKGKLKRFSEISKK